MSKTKKTNLLDSKFYRIYFSCLAAAVMLILLGTVWLMGVLRDVESAQPIYVARQVARLFEDKNFADIYALDKSAGQIAQGDKVTIEMSPYDLEKGRIVFRHKSPTVDAPPPGGSAQRHGPPRRH